MKTTVVIAGNQRQFNDIVVELCKNAKAFTVYPTKAIIDGVRFLYCTDARMLKGLRDIDFKFYGTWYERKDINEIKEEARFRLLSENKPVPWEPL